jgi:hypothetical protein
MSQAALSNGWRMLLLLAGLFLLPYFTSVTQAGDDEYIGQFMPELKADAGDFDQVIFRPFRDTAKLKFARPPDDLSNLTVARLMHPPQDKSAILAALAGEADETPTLYADTGFSSKK